MVQPARSIRSVLLAAVWVMCPVALAAALAEEQAPVTTVSAPSQAASSDPLLEQVERAIYLSSRRYLDVDVHTPWQIIHGILALRHDFLVRQNGEKVNAIEWMSNGPEFRGTPWFQVTRHGGRAQPYTKPYLFEGHPNQFLGYLTMADLPP
jgi:hypothetical protein